MNTEQNTFYLKHIKKQTVKKEQIIPMSSQQKEVALLYVLQGQGTVYFDNDFLGIKHHDVLLIDLQKDSYYSSDDMELFLLVVGGPFVQDILPTQNLFTIQQHQAFYTSLLLLEKEQHHSQFTKIKHFIHLLTFLYDDKNRYTLKQSDHPMQKAIRYIEHNFSNQELDIDELAKYTGFSSYYFIRKFKTYTKKTPYQYILHMRLEHAKYLLKYTEKQLDAIAKESGFNSDISFINRFTKHNKLSPTTYRKLKEM